MAEGWAQELKGDVIIEPYSAGVVLNPRAVVVMAEAGGRYFPSHLQRSWIDEEHYFRLRDYGMQSCRWPLPHFFRQNTRRSCRI